MLEEQRAEIRRWLGITGRFPNVDARLEQALDQLGVSPNDECQVVEMSEVCKSIDTQIRNLATGCLKVVDIEGVQLRGAYALDTLRSMGRQYSGSISKIIGIPLEQGGFFSATGASQIPGPMGSGNFPPYG